MATQRINDLIFAGQPDEDPQTLGEIVDAGVYRAMLIAMPALVESISILVTAGQSSAQIEQRMVAKFGRSQTTRNVRHVANYLARMYRA